jgi:uncharacterized protein (DUF1697 family)
MQKYISLLRGINVGGHKKIIMNDLKLCYESLNFQKIHTFIQSGNVVFESNNNDIDEIETIIENKIIEKYNFEVSVIIRTPQQLQEVFDKNPFKENQSIENLYITFAKNYPKNIDVHNFISTNFENDNFAIMDKEIYLNYKNGYRNTKFSNTFLKKNSK